MTIIPATDILNGECVRLTKGDYSKSRVYYKDPADVAKFFEGNGFKRLHIVDLDGARESFPQNLPVLERIKGQTGLTVQFGGGIKSDESLKDAFNAGADMVICGSIAAKDPHKFRKWLLEYGGEKIILGADVRNGKIAVSGWLEDTSADLIPFVNSFLDDGLKKLICTDISRDGTLEGPNMDLYEDLILHFPSTEITVSGGVSSMADIERIFEKGLPSVIVGKAIYEGKIKMEDLRQWLQKG